ncbi:MAG: class I SAM-dependent methyltransferase [Gemmatimonadales bacterium]
MAFRDHFSRDSDAYATFRPRYPDALSDWLAGVAPARRLVWDCATGTGQAALDLADRFERVIATDASGEQIRAAIPHSRVEYRVARAQSSGIEAGTVDLVTIAQALHWLDLGSFYDEVRRVARPGALLAAWTYGISHVLPAVDEVVDRFYRGTVGPWWPPERVHVDRRYADLPFPFPRLAAPEFNIEAHLTLDAYVGYLSTWSATRRYIQAGLGNPLPEVRAELARHWGDAAQARRVAWPLALLAGRVHPD